MQKCWWGWRSRWSLGGGSSDLQSSVTPQRGNSVKTRLKFALHSLLPEGPQEIRGSYVHIRELKCLASLALI